MSTADLQVVVDPPADPVKPVQQAPGKAPWSKKAKALTGLGLLCLVAIPAIVAPVVVTQQKKAAQGPHATPIASDGSSPAAAQAGGPDGKQLDPDSFVELNSTRTRPRRNTTFDATALDANSTLAANGTLKVPRRTFNATRATRPRTKRRANMTVTPEPFSPFVGIANGQVGGWRNTAGAAGAGPAAVAFSACKA